MLVSSNINCSGVATSIGQQYVFQNVSTVTLPVAGLPHVRTFSGKKKLMEVYGDVEFYGAQVTISFAFPVKNLTVKVG